MKYKYIVIDKNGIKKEMKKASRPRLCDVKKKLYDYKHSNPLCPWYTTRLDIFITIERFIIFNIIYPFSSVNVNQNVHVFLLVFENRIKEKLGQRIKRGYIRKMDEHGNIHYEKIENYVKPTLLKELSQDWGKEIHFVIQDISIDWNIITENEYRKTHL